jgi:Ca-activated chloride channel family protein
MSQQQPFAERPKAAPAWMLSLFTHIVLLIAMSFLLVGTNQARVAGEKARPVGIVLSQKISETQTEYFSETQDSTIESEQDSETAIDRNDALANAAKATPDSLVITELALPDSASIPLPGVGTVETPSLTVSGRRPKIPGLNDSAIIAEEQARMRAANARGPTTSLGLFGSREAVGNSFIFLIDRSKSMGGKGLGVLQDAEKELVRVLKPLQPEHRFQVIVYHDKTVYMNERRLLSGTEENKAAVSEFLSGKAAFGATEHELALRSALSHEPDVIFLLTDGGEPALDGLKLRRIAKLAGSRTAVHCLHFGSGPLQEEDNFLRRLAALTGGEYGYIDVRQRRK